MVGRTVAQYQLNEKLGSGGMGDIYKALDTRLNRSVAIKVLPADKSKDLERRRRFIQEAQAASALNHPNIVTIHDIVSSEGTEFMVMEFVAGKTLLEKIPNGGMRVAQALQYAVQIADALAAAHAAGIIHRDLKPSNVMITGTGLIKILDFGLAKFAGGPLMQAGEGETMDAPLTMEGAILGTLCYMSPEQAEGKRVDARSDIFSFGSVLYEMVTGRRAFDGNSGISTLTAVLRDEIKPIALSAPDVPPLLEGIIGQCVRKDPDARFQSMREVHEALAALKLQYDSDEMHRSQFSVPPTAPPQMPPPIPTSFPAAAVPPPISGVTQAPPPPPPQAGGPATATTIGPGGPIPPIPASPAATTAVPQPAPPKQPAPSKPGSSKPGSSKGLVFALLGLLVITLAAGGVGGWWWWTHRSHPAPPPVATTPVVQPAPEPPKPAPTPEPPPEVVLNNDSVVQMVQASTPADQIVSQIHSAKTSFDVSPAAVRALAKAGVPKQVIDAMRAAAGVPPPDTTAQQAQKKQTAPPPLPSQSQPPQTQAAAPPAQSTAPPPKPQNTTPPPAPRQPVAQTVAVPVSDGQPFLISLAEDVPANVTAGTPVHLVVADNVRINDAVVLAKGAAVTGEVAEVGKKKIFGIGGKINFRLLTVDAVDGKKLSVRATSGAGGEGGPKRPFDTGKNQHPKELAASAGTQYIGYINGEQTVSVKK